MNINVKNMVPVAMSNLLLDQPNVIDAYIKLGEDRFVLLYRQGDFPEFKRVNHYAKNVGQVWFLKEDIHLLFDRNIKLSEVAASAKGINTSEKVKYYVNAAEGIFKEMSYLEFNEKSFQRAQTLVQITLEIFKEFEDVNVLVEQLRSFSDSIFMRSITTAGVASLIGEAMGWESRVKMEALIAGAILQDVGLMSLPKELFEKPLGKMSETEKELYELHPLISKKKLSEFPEINSDILSVVAQHHELPSGKGYPGGLKKVNIYPLSEVVILSGIFADLILFEGHDGPVMSKESAVSYIQNTILEPFSLKAIRALETIIKK